MTSSLHRKRARQGGFSILEVMIVATMMTTVLASVAVGIRAGHAANQEMQRKTQLTEIASELMERLFRIDFGAATDPAPTSAQLDELFDDDDNLGTATLSSLRVGPGQSGYKFGIAGFPYGGLFEVRVNADLNSDGDEKDAHEGRSDLLHVSILHDGELVLDSMRCAPW